MGEGYGTSRRNQMIQKMELDRRTRKIRRWLYNAKDDGYLFLLLIVGLALSTIPWIIWGTFHR